MTWFKICIIILLGLQLPISLWCQETTVFAPLGATWYYTPSDYGGGEFPFFTFVAEKDTFLNGFNAREIACYIYDDGEFHHREDLTKYIATIGNKVYYKVANDFVLLYDFGGMPGDTIHSSVEGFGIFMGCDSEFYLDPVIAYSYVIDSVDAITIDGLVLRRQFLNIIEKPGFEPTWYFQGPVVERIGHNSFGGIWWGRGESCILEHLGFLRCYMDNDISFRNPYFSQAFECNFSDIKILSSPFTSVTVYPNPSNDIIYLDKEINDIHIYNSCGQRMSFVKNGNEVNISNLLPGIYYLNFKTSGESITTRFVKSY